LSKRKSVTAKEDEVLDRIDLVNRNLANMRQDIAAIVRDTISQVLKNGKSTSRWGIDKMTRFNDPIIDQTSYNKELFAFLKTIFPDVESSSKLETAIYHNTRWVGSPTPKIKASMIICPKPDCDYHCVEDRDPLIDHFLRHMKRVHRVTPSNQFVDNLKGKISYLRNNNHVPYIDPFVHVQWSDLF
jgi:hypothetical protein